jgi:hypothetical protein
VITLVLGYLGSLHTEARRERRERERLLSERLADVAREALFEVQDLIHTSSVGLVDWFTHGTFSKQSGASEPTLPPPPPALHGAVQRIAILSTRIIDDDLRNKVGSVTEDCVESMECKSVEEADEHLHRMYLVARAVGEKLRSPLATP